MQALNKILSSSYLFTVRVFSSPSHGKASISNTPASFCLPITLTSCPLAKPGHQRDIDIPVCNRGYFVFIHVILHKGVWVGKLVFLLSLQKKTEGHVREQKKTNQPTNKKN